MKTKNSNSPLATSILHECFNNFSAKESRELLWKLFSLTISGSFCSQPVQERENLVAFYEHLQQVLEVVGELVEEDGEEGDTAQSRVFKNIPKNPE